MPSWLLMYQTQISSMAATAAGLAFLFVLFAWKSQESRVRQKSLAVAARLMRQQKLRLNAFGADERVPDAVRLRLVKIVTVLLNEDLCIAVIKKAHSSAMPTTYPEDLRELCEIDPELANEFEDIISGAIVAMFAYSPKVQKCVREMIADLMVSAGRRRLINIARDVPAPRIETASA
jgi:hypothetical protein